MTWTRLWRRAAAVVTLLLGVAGASDVRADSARALIDDFHLTSWTEADGLPAGRLRTVTQDAAGYLWIGGDGGLVRFDGSEFHLWNGRVSPVLPSGPINALLGDRDGSLWVGLSGRTPVARITSGRVILFGEAEGLAFGYTRALLKDHAGTLWVSTSSGLYWLEAGRWHRAGAAMGLPDGATLAVFEDRQQRLWVGTTSAIFRRAPGQPFERVDAVDVSSNLWQGFAQDKRGRVFVSDVVRGFREPGAKDVVGTTAPRRGWGAALLHDRRGNLWVGTQGQGLWRVRDAAPGTPSSLRVATTDDGLMSDSMQSIYEDRDGTIWLATLAGLQRLVPHLVKPIRDLPIPRSIAATADGSVWIGTAAGLTGFTAAGRRHYGEAEGLPGTLVFALQHDGDNGLWISTERGLTHFSNGRFAPTLTPTDSRQRIIGIARSAEGLWLRDFGLNVFEWSRAHVRPVERLPDGFGRAALSAFVDRAGQLWLGTTDGSVAVRDATGMFKTYPLGLGRVLCFTEDDEGVWVGGDGGAARIGPRGLLRLSRRNGFVGSVKSLVTDRHGGLWVGAGSGLSRVDREELEAVTAEPGHLLRRRYYTAADGMAGVPYSEGSATAARAADGRLWFVTTTGVTVVDPDHISEPNAGLSPTIEALTTDSIARPVLQQVELPSRTAHMQIAFGAAAVRDPSRVGFRYQLEGFDRDWVDAGQSRLASYTHLPPRDYRFRVAVTNGDGVWSEQEAVLALSVEPAFVQTRWFYALMIGATALLVLGAWRLHVRQVRREFAMVLAERVRLGRALHDTLLQGLASMALQVDDVAYHVDGAPATAKERLRYIRWQVEDHIRRARHEIWELRSPILESHDLLRAIRRAAEEAAACRPVELTVSSTGAPRLGTPAVVENLVFIGQEAVSNAVRHGRASRVTVSLDYEADAMRLTVSDDGGGFDPEAARPGHYGLVGMRERAEHLRGRLAIQSAPGRGTRVEASVPVQ